MKQICRHMAVLAPVLGLLVVMVIAASATPSAAAGLHAGGQVSVLAQDADFYLDAAPLNTCGPGVGESCQVLALGELADRQVARPSYHCEVTRPLVAQTQPQTCLRPDVPVPISVRQRA